MDLQMSVVICPKCKKNALGHGTVKGLVYGEYHVGYYCPNKTCELYRVLFVAEQDV